MHDGSFLLHKATPIQSLLASSADEYRLEKMTRAGFQLPGNRYPTSSLSLRVGYA